tara:strand:- start:7326 stop:7934 length:609 start_codon:yes stop_codon:yes gene_type:complete
MAGSDIVAQTIVDAQAASTTFVAAAARPSSTFTIANSSFTQAQARKLSVTTTGASDNGKTVTIVGTDLNGKSLTEVIVSTGSAATVSGSKYFKTIVSATCSAQYAANVSVGMTSEASASFNTGRTRLKAFTTISNSVSHRVDFIDGLAPEDDNAVVVFITKTSGINNAADDVYIPEEGVLFKTNLIIKYDVAGAHMVTAFHA